MTYFAGGHRPLFPWWQVIIFAVLALASLRMFTCGVDLTPEAAIVHGWRKRVVPWSEVTGVAAEKTGGTTVAAVYLTGRRRVRLEAPNGGTFNGNRKFGPQFHTVAQYWATHRGVVGPGTGPEPEAEPATHLEPIYYSRPIGHFSEAYVTASHGELAATAPATSLAKSASVLVQVGAISLFFPPGIACLIVALVFSVSARRQLREHGLAMTSKVAGTLYGSIVFLVFSGILWTGFVLLFIL